MMIRLAEFFAKFIEKRLATTLFVVFAIVGLFSFESYGISWDEPAQRDIGKTNLAYIVNHDSSLERYADRDYGPVFEIPLVAIEQIFKLTDNRQAVFYMRHALTHLFFLVGAMFFFKLVSLLFKSSLLSTLGFLLIVVCPLLYAHSFFNTKDLPFLSMFMICLYATAKAFSLNRRRDFIILAICCGLLVNLRIMGSLLVVTILAMLVIDTLMNFKNHKLGRHTLINLVLFSLLVAATVYVTWPFLWKNPIGNFMTAFSDMSRFRWDGNVLFLGSQYRSTQLPWFYGIVWFAVTTPTIYLLIGIFGIASLLFAIIRSPKGFFANNVNRNSLVHLICFVVPLAAVVLLKSVLYDGWRQLFFVYPAFILVGLFGLNSLLGKKLRKIVISFCVAGILMTGVIMVTLSPFQNLYFNELVAVGKPLNYLRSNFEMDYWGVTFRKSLEFIVANDRSSEIKIYSQYQPGESNAMMLPKDDRERIKFVNQDDATYVITNYRYHPQDYVEFEGKNVFDVVVNNNVVNTVFKIR